MVDREKDYHRDRARAELDHAYRATHKGAAQAHMRLSALHMNRLREMDAGEGSGGRSDGLVGT